ncbi:MAG: tyrosine-type recombinase/integrase [Acidimicrobiales bacterium]
MAKSKGRRAHGEGSIFERADGRWSVQLDMGVVDGKRSRSTAYAASQAEAVQRLKEMQRKRDEGRPPLDSSQKLNRFVPWWLDNVIDLSNLADSTKASYRAEAEKHIIPALGEHSLARLQTQHIATWMGTMTKAAEEDAATKRADDGDTPKARYDGKPSANTRRIRYAVLHRALNDAIDFGLISRNPASPVKAPRAERDETKVYALALEEAQAILKAATDHRLTAAWYILILMGLRRGEVLGLRWSDLDLTTGQMRIQQSLGRVKGKGLVFSAPKTATSNRACPIPLVVLDTINTHWVEQEIERAEHGGWPDTDLVFVTATGNPIEPSNLGRMFQTVCKKAGHGHERLHNLRHTAATVMRVYGGADLLDVSRLLGHSSIRVTADMYGHTVPTVQEQIASRVSDVFTVAKTSGK